MTKKKKPAGEPRKVRRVLFGDFADRWEDTILVMKKPATIKLWTQDMRGIKRAFRTIALEDLSYVIVQQYFTDLVKLGLAPKTVSNKWLCLSACLNQAKREGLISEIPKPVLPKLGRPPQDWFTIEELQGLLMVARDPAYSFYFLLAENGARIGEHLAIKVKSIDLKKKTLKIDESLFEGELQDPKTESSKRTNYLSDFMCEKLALLMHGKAPDDFIFAKEDGSPLEYGAVLGTFQEHQAMAGIEPRGFHAFRRANITFCTKQLHMPEGILGFRVGHRAGGTTLGVYLQEMDGSDKPWRNKIADLLLQDIEEEDAA